MSKILLLCGGGDWTDASADLLVMPDGAEPEADKKAYPGYREAGRRCLRQWLVEERSYREPTADEVVEMWDH